MDEIQRVKESISKFNERIKRRRGIPWLDRLHRIQFALVWIFLAIQLFSSTEQRVFMEPWWTCLYLFNLATFIPISLVAFYFRFWIKKKHQYVAINEVSLDGQRSGVFTWRCLHCEDIVHAPIDFIQAMPTGLAECEYGVKVRFTEPLTPGYNCVKVEE